MAHILSEEERNELIEIMNSAEPYGEDDPIMDRSVIHLDMECDLHRMLATLAKLCLEGKL